MKFYPHNRFLLVDKIEEPKEEESSGVVLLPEDYQARKDHEVVRLLEAPADSQINAEIGSLLVVEPHMVREATVMGAKYYLVTENAVIGEVVQDEESTEEVEDLLE